MIIGNSSGGNVGSIVSTTPFRAILGNGGAAIAQKIMARRAVRGMYPSLHTKHGSGSDMVREESGGKCSCDSKKGGSELPDLDSLGNHVITKPSGLGGSVSKISINSTSDEAKERNPLLDANNSPDGAGDYSSFQKDTGHHSQAGSLQINSEDEQAGNKRNADDLSGWGSGMTESKKMKFSSKFD